MSGQPFDFMNKKRYIILKNLVYFQDSFSVIYFFAIIFKLNIQCLGSR